jgi:lipid-A-disaccharide synthase
MRVVAVTGEASGDLIAADALSRFLEANPQAELAGIGGDRLRDVGMECWFTSDDLAVRGYVEALSKLVHILAVRYWLCEYIDKWKPGLYLGVDAPDFNLGVEAKLRAKGMRTVHLISPSIWAWRPERIVKIKQAVDHMLCIFPFEPDVYSGTGVRATYVGHPIADMIAPTIDQHAARKALGLTSGRAVVAVLPGSRQGEIRHNGNAFLGAAMRLSRVADVVIPAASSAIAQQIRRHPSFAPAEAAGVRLLVAAEGDPGPISHTAMAACDVALVASGTATLEVALHKRPMVIGYRVPALTYALMKRRALISDIGLPNILLGERVVPELVQEEANPESLTQAVLQWLDDPTRCRSVEEQFSQLHDRLRCGAAARVAEILHDDYRR